MKKEITTKKIEKKALEPADLNYISGGTEEIFKDGDIEDRKDEPGTANLPFTRYPPTHAR